MKVVGLLSGGKDSCYNLCHCAKLGHEIVALATLAPPEGTDELDSYMYQTVGHDAVHLVAEAMQLPLYRHIITGKPLQTDSSFGILRSASPGSKAPADESEQDETEDLHLLLRQVKQHHPDVQGVSVGAILSNYQRFRVETICARAELQLQPLAYLWQRDQSELLAEMVQAGVEAVLIKCAGIGLDQRDLRKSLAIMRPKLERLKGLYGAHVCGEGGEYETLTLDCPLFKKRIQLDEIETVVDSTTSFASVAYLRVHKASLLDKEVSSSTMDDVTISPVLDGLGGLTKSVAQYALQEAESSKSAAHTCLSHLPKLDGTSAHRPLETATCRKKGQWVAFSGITADLDELSSSSSPTGASRDAEVSAAFAKLRQVLNFHKLDIPHVQHLNLSLRDQAAFLDVNKAYKQHFDLEPPTRATVALPHLRRAGSKQRTVELDGWAYDDGSVYTCEKDQEVSSFASSAPSSSPTAPRLRQVHPGSRSHRQTLHVQSLSYWASANIGPYSQGLVNASRMSIAGQIGLLPVDLSLPAGQDGVAMQYALSLQHARRIFRAVLEERNRGGKGWVEGGVCWIARPTLVEGESDSNRLKAALRCWGAQDSASHLVPGGPTASQDPSEEGEDEDVEPDDTDWLFGSEGIVNRSERRGVHALPMLYVQLGEKDLPRGAAVEWQLTAHDGKNQLRTIAAMEDDEDSEESEEAERPVARHVTFTLPLSSLQPLKSSFPSPSSSPPSGSLELSHQYISSRSGGSSFGILALRFNPNTTHTTSATALAATLSELELTGESARAFADVQSRLRAALSVKVFVSLQSQAEGQGRGEEDGGEATGLEEHLHVARALFRAFTGHVSDEEEGSATGADTLPAYAVAAALRLSTVRSAAAAPQEKGGRWAGGAETGEEWDDWQVAFVWHDVE